MLGYLERSWHPGLSEALLEPSWAILGGVGASWRHIVSYLEPCRAISSDLEGRLILDQKGPSEDSRPSPSRSRGGGRGKGGPLPEGEEGSFGRGNKYIVRPPPPRGLAGYGISSGLVGPKNLDGQIASHFAVDKGRDLNGLALDFSGNFDRSPARHLEERSIEAFRRGETDQSGLVFETASAR